MKTVTRHHPECRSHDGGSSICNCTPIVITEIEPAAFVPNTPGAADIDHAMGESQPAEGIAGADLSGTIGFTHDGDNVKLGHAPQCPAAKGAEFECACGFARLMAAAISDGAVLSDGRPAAVVMPKEGDDLPDGDYAICEFMGHRTIIGRVQEIERFGAKYMGVEAIFQGKLLPQVLMGGSSVYGFTPCSKEQALKRAPKRVWELPDTLAAAVPELVKEIEPAPQIEYDDRDQECEDEEESLF